MNKNFKSLVALVLAVMMLLVSSAMATTTAATSGTSADVNGKITIDNAVNGQTYKIYKLLDLESYDTARSAYAYKIASAWNTFFSSGAGAGYLTMKGDYVTGLASGHTVADLAAAAKAAVPDTDDGYATASGTTVTFDDLALGYYLVVSSTGAICSLDTTNNQVIIKEKNGVPELDKTVQEDSAIGTGALGDGVNGYDETNDAEIGETVYFKSVIKVTPGTHDYVMKDSMTAGLTWSGVSSVTVKVDNATVDSESNYTVAADTTNNGFTVTFTDTYIASLQADLNVTDTSTDNDYKEITVLYSAVVNENAAINTNSNDNTARLEYKVGTESHNTPDDTTHTYVYEFKIFKYTGNNTALDGATFQIKDSSKAVLSFVVKTAAASDTAVPVYRLAKTGDTNTVNSITTNKSGKFEIEGLDAGTYYYEETEAPTGYNKITGDYEFKIAGVRGTTAISEKMKGDVIYNDTIQTDKTLKVLNETGTLLPATGGIGTTIFYVAGSILVLAAAILLITKRRMGSND